MTSAARGRRLHSPSRSLGPAVLLYGCTAVGSQQAAARFSLVRQVLCVPTPGYREAADLGMTGSLAGVTVCLRDRHHRSMVQGPDGGHASAHRATEVSQRCTAL